MPGVRARVLWVGLAVAGIGGALDGCSGRLLADPLGSAGNGGSNAPGGTTGSGGYQGETSLSPSCPRGMHARPRIRCPATRPAGPRRRVRKPRPAENGTYVDTTGLHLRPEQGLLLLRDPVGGQRGLPAGGDAPGKRRPAISITACCATAPAVCRAAFTSIRPARPRPVTAPASLRTIRACGRGPVPATRRGLARLVPVAERSPAASVARQERAACQVAPGSASPSAHPPSPRVRRAGPRISSSVTSPAVP